jgi:hypothetical protein
MDLALLSEILINAGPLAALAGFALWMLNRVWSDRCREEARHSEQIADLQKQTLAALNANTEAVTRLTERLDKS